MPKCPFLRVTNADFASSDGDYVYSFSLKVSWAPDRPVYRHKEKDRVLFWNSGGLGWSIGKSEYLSSGSHWHRSGLDTEEPWQGDWEGGVKVTRMAEEEEEEGAQLWVPWAQRGAPGWPVAPSSSEPRTLCMAVESYVGDGKATCPRHWAPRVQIGVG